jgi:hypothetical protein
MGLQVILMLNYIKMYIFLSFQKLTLPTWGVGFQFIFLFDSRFMCLLGRICEFLCGGVVQDSMCGMNGLFL